MAKIDNSDSTKCRWGFRKARSYIVGENRKWYSHSGRIWLFLRKLKIHIIWPSNLHLGALTPENLKHFYNKTFTHMFTAALLVISQNCQYCSCLLEGEWLNKLVHLYCGILCSNKNEQIIDTSKTFIDLKDILFSEKVNLKRLNTIYFHLYNNLKMIKLCSIQGT